MPLFVPILRLLMLFLNVYDSYKTLKLPPPSSRNAGRPSVRAMSQRKRDMKGCLAVWIVWVALSMYERMVESIVCLLIPFYNELKSMALLFLILTRARGAEPIYLHLIRPLLKPYTATLDGVLDLMLMFGDFIFAVSMYPIHLGTEWWQRRFASKSDGFATAQESTSSEYSSDADISDARSSLFASSAAAESVNVGSVLPSKRSNGRHKTPSRRSTGETATRKPTIYPGIGGVDDVGEPTGQHNEASRAREPSPESLSRKNTRTPTDKPSSNTESDSINLPQASTSQHQIWYPPNNSISDDEDLMQAAILKQEQQQLDDWRQYPAFPSAYPPTPLAVTSTLVTASLATYPPIQEEHHQDFHPSLLPQLEPLNPSLADDTSDVNFTTSGNSPSVVDDENMSSDNDDDEDQFNITLRTPLPAMGSLRSRIDDERSASMFAPSVASVNSRASALTTSDIESPMRTHDSFSSDLSSSAPQIADSVPVIGKKRALPRNESHMVAHRVRQIEQAEPQATSDDDSMPITGTLMQQNRKLLRCTIPRLGNSADNGPSNIILQPPSSDEGVKENIRRQRPVPPEEKRRKVVRAAAPTAVEPKRPASARPRVTKNVSGMPIQSQKSKKFLEVPTASSRSSTRIRAVSPTAHYKGLEGDDSTAASSGDQAQPLAPQRLVARNVPRKR